jgi:hypothetical protein
VTSYTHESTCLFRLTNRQPFYQLREKSCDDDVGRVQYDATAGNVTVYVDGNSGNRYAARPTNDSQYNKVIPIINV